VEYLAHGYPARITRTTVYARMEKFGLRPEPTRQAAPGPPWPVERTAEPPAPDTRLQWERRNLTLLRVDLRNTDRLDAWSQASRALDAVIAKVHSFGGRVEEVTPTGLVAAFGLEPGEDAPRRAAHAALAIQKGAQRARESSGGVPGVTIGLHVAPLLTDASGHGSRSTRGQARSVANPRPATAGEGARRDGCQWGGRAISGAPVRAHAAGRRGGRTGTSLLPHRPGAPGLGLWGAMTRFVGRQEELDLLRSRLTMAGSGHGQVVAVVGEAGWASRV